MYPQKQHKILKDRKSQRRKNRNPNSKKATIQKDKSRTTIESTKKQLKQLAGFIDKNQPGKFNKQLKKLHPDTLEIHIDYSFKVMRTHSGETAMITGSKNHSLQITIIGIALLYNRLDFAKKLYDKGCDVNAIIYKNSHETNLLTFFSLTLLEKKGFIPDEWLAGVKWLLAHGANVNFEIVEKKVTVNFFHHVIALANDNIPIHKDLIQILLDAGVDLEKICPHYEMKPITLANNHEKPNIAGLIESKQAKLKAINTVAEISSTTTQEKTTTAHGAAYYNDLKSLMKIAKRNRSALSTSAKSGLTPLHVAFICNSFAAIKFLTSTGIAIDISSSYAIPAYLFGLIFGSDEIKAWLYKKHNIKPLTDDENQRYVGIILENFCSNQTAVGYLQNLCQVIEPDMLVNTPKATLPILYVLVFRGFIHEVKTLLERGADPNILIDEKNLLTIFLARDGYSEKHKIAMVKLLLQYNIDVNAGTSDAFNYIALLINDTKNQITLANLLIERKANLNRVTTLCLDERGIVPSYFTPLIFAIIYDLEALIRLYLKNGASLFIATASYPGPLILCIMDKSKQKYLPLLLEYLTDLSQFNYDDLANIFNVMCSYCEKSIIKSMLLKLSAMPEVIEKTHPMNNPLFHKSSLINALINPDPQVCIFLLKQGFNLPRDESTSNNLLYQAMYSKTQGIAISDNVILNLIIYYRNEKKLAILEFVKTFAEEHELGLSDSLNRAIHALNKPEVTFPTVYSSFTTSTSLEKDVTSGRRHLEEQGFTPEQIKALKTPALESEEEEEVIATATIKPETITWLDGTLTSDSINVQRVAKSSNHYFVFSDEILKILKSTAGGDKFITTRVKMAADEGDTGLKGIKIGSKLIATINSIEYETSFKWQLKIKGFNENFRVFCIQIAAGRHQLVVACKFGKALHDLATINKLKEIKAVEMTITKELYPEKSIVLAK